MWMTTSGAARANASSTRGVVADVGAHVVARGRSPTSRELVQRGLRRHAVGEAGHARAHRLQPQREPRALEAGVAGEQDGAAAPEVRIDERRHAALMLVPRAVLRRRPTGDHA